MTNMPDQTAGPNVHIFTTVEAALFLKQFPCFSPWFGGMHFTFGTEVPDDTDVLIVHTRASYSIPTTLPRERTVFFAGEPDVIHPYGAAFLNQFGLVMSATTRPLGTEQLRSAFCAVWFAGFDMSKPRTDEHLLGYDWFRAQNVPPKLDKISIVTSNKVATPYHRKRLEFIGELVKLIPDRIEMFGHGHRSVPDKKDALLPYRYHLAIENGEGRDVWTEKLSDPYLCWAFPFYAGCSNLGDYFPQDAYHYMDLDNPHAAAADMVRMMENGHWDRVRPALDTARERVLEDYNIATMFARLARMALEKPVPARLDRPRMIWSERSFWPEKGRRGGVAEFVLRNILLAVDRKAELRLSSLHKRLEERRSARRTARREWQERAN